MQFLPASPTRVVGTPVAYGLDHFKDRSHERGVIRELILKPPLRMIVLVGRRGIGKSALAAKAVEELVSDSHHLHAVLLSSRTEGIRLEQLFLDCSQLLDEDNAEHLLRIWSSQRSLRDKVICLIRAFSEKRCLILLDNLEDHQDVNGTLIDGELSLFLDHLFRVSHGMQVLVTSQRPVTVTPAARRHVRHIPLQNGLPERDAISLLRELDPAGEAGLRDADTELLRRAVSRVHGIPRALELIVGALLDDFLTLPSLEEVLQTFAQRGDVLNELANTSYARLTADKRLLIQVLGVFRTPVPLAAVEFVLHRVAPTADAGSLLAELARSYMLTVDRQSREYVLHPMDADIAYADLPERGARNRSVLELLVADWYAARALPEQEWQTAQDLTPQRAEFSHRVRGGDWDRAGRVFNAVGWFMARHGAVHAAIEMYEGLMLGPVGDASVRANAMVNGAYARLIGGPLTVVSSIVAEALPALATLQDRGGMWKAHLVIGDAKRRFGELDDAVSHLQTAADICRELRDPHDLAQALLSLGLAYAYRGDITEAHAVCDEIGRLADDDADMHAHMLDLRSTVRIREQRWQDAYDAATASVAYYDRAKILEPVGYALNVAGLARLGLGDTDLAIETLSAASRHDAVLENPRPRGLCLFNLAWAHCRAGNWVLAHASAVAARQAMAESESDLDAVGALCNAIETYLDGDAAGAAGQLRATAEACRLNSDLAPAEWSLELADELMNYPTD